MSAHYSVRRHYAYAKTFIPPIGQGVCCRVAWLFSLGVFARACHRRAVSHLHQRQAGYVGRDFLPVPILLFWGLRSYCYATDVDRGLGHFAIVHKESLIVMLPPNQSAAASNRRPAGQADGSGNLLATVAADRAFPAAVAELGLGRFAPCAFSRSFFSLRLWLGAVAPLPRRQPAAQFSMRREFLRLREQQSLQTTHGLIERSFRHRTTRPTVQVGVCLFGVYRRCPEATDLF